MALDMAVEERPPAVVAKLVGEAGAASVDQLSIHLMKLTARKPALVVLDVSALSFISSLGMGALVSFQRGIQRQHGEVRVAGASANVAESFERAGLRAVLKCYDSVDAALQPTPA